MKVKVLTFKECELIETSEVEIPAPQPTIEDRVKVLENTVEELDLAR